MSNDKSNFIASLLDEAPSKEKIDLLIADDELKKQWERYHLAQDVMSDQAPERIHLNLASSICAAIAEEPAHDGSDNKSDNVTSLAQWRLNRLMKPEWLKQAAGFAIAASVTAVTIFSYQNLVSPVSTVIVEEPRVADVSPIIPTQPSMASSGNLSANEKRRFMEVLLRHEQLATEPGYHAGLEIRKQLEEVIQAKQRSKSQHGQDKTELPKSRLDKNNQEK